MKKKILFILALSLIICAPLRAEVLKARAVDEISTKNPTEVISVKLVRDFALDENTTLKEGYILTGKMLDITNPEKWHKNASFTFIPTSYRDLDGTEHKIDKEIRAEYKQKIKPVHTEWGVGLPNGGYFSPTYVTNIKRMAKGEGKEVVDEYYNRSTPWGKGIEIQIKKDEVLYFNFPD